MQPDQSSQPVPPVHLLRHDGVIFEDQTVYLTGNAYFNCEFKRCAFVVVGTPFSVLNGCKLEGCIWHLNVVLHDQQQAMGFVEFLKNVVQRSVPTSESGGPDVGPVPAKPPLVGDTVTVNFPIFCISAPDTSDGRQGFFTVNAGDIHCLALFSSMQFVREFCEKGGVIVAENGFWIREFKSPEELLEFAELRLLEDVPEVTFNPDGVKGSPCHHAPIQNLIASLRKLIATGVPPENANFSS